MPRNNPRPPQHRADSADSDGEGIASLHASCDRRFGRAHRRSRRHVLVRLVARHEPEVPGKERSAVQIGFAVDRSGSMCGGKLEMAKRAVGEALQQLLIKDSFAVVWFDDKAVRLEACQRATAQAVQSTVDACADVQTGGSTALFDGWNLAADTLCAAREADARARVLLITDGQANEGPSDEHQLGPAARAWRDKGISTSCIGIGDGYNERLLAAMAREGGGNDYFAATGADLPGIVGRELGEVKAVVARGAVLQVRPSPGVRVEVLSGFRNSWTGADVHVDLGDLVADQEVTVALRVTLPAGEFGDTCGVECSAILEGEPALVPAALVEWTLADARTNDSQPRDFAVDREMGRQYAARARMRAVDLNRRGRYREAAAELKQTALRIADYMAADPELRALVAALTQDAERMAVEQDEMMRKQMYTLGNYDSRSKHGDGSSRRSADRT
ncbi:MAG: VWA domain-containing protein [Deltaproteobacteria bacterium]|nr:VWA domain-containing protein [Deltaproteobacteria bacterium]